MILKPFLHRFRMLQAIFAACALAAPGASFAQAYPDKPIRLVVPFTAAGSTTLLARIISQHVSPLYGQQIIVDNKPGAAGHVGAEFVARSPADGYTLLFGTIGIHAAYALYSKLAYDPAKELRPVIMLIELPLVLVVHPTSPAKTVQDFIAMAKAKPGDINFSSAGSGSSTHLTPQLPGVPTIAESGVPGYESTGWFTIAAPAKTPAAIVQKLNADLNAMLAHPDIQSRLKDLGMTIVGGTPEFAANYYARETEKWTRVIKTAGLKAD